MGWQARSHKWKVWIKIFRHIIQVWKAYSTEVITSQNHLSIDQLKTVLVIINKSSLTSNGQSTQTYLLITSI